MASTEAGKREAMTSLMPMLGDDDVTVDIRIGRANHMAFLKLDPVAMANFLATGADDAFRREFWNALKRYGVECPDVAT